MSSISFQPTVNRTATVATAAAVAGGASAVYSSYKNIQAAKHALPGLKKQVGIYIQNGVRGDKLTLLRKHFSDCLKTVKAGIDWKAAAKKAGKFAGIAAGAYLAFTAINKYVFGKKEA